MDVDKYNRFSELISTFEMHKPKKEVISREELLTLFTDIIKDLGILKEKVYEKRKAETESIIEANKHKIQFSTFEVMGHNFRENTHSKVLKYLFHHKFIEEGKGSKILSEFIDKITKGKQKNLVKLIKKEKYTISLEHPIEIIIGNKKINGRIDLLIKDDDEKAPFVIVIENKINADVGVKAVSKEGKITETQLTYYQKYVEENFKNYKHYFILLSFKEVEDNFDKGKFVLTNYDGLIEILNEIESDNNILNEYKKLLYSIKKLGNSTRESLIDLMYSFDNDEIMSLIKLQQINKNFEYEK